MTTELALLSRVSYRDTEITSRRLRGLLALLAGDLRTGCGTARLVEGLWPDEQPENPTKALQILVSRARAQLGTDLIVKTPTGYRLSLSEDQVDTSAIMLSASASARHSRAGDHAAALAHAEAGLALWDGATGGDSDDPLSALRTERIATHRSLVRARALALSRLGRRAEAIEPLAELARDRPRDEEILLELLRCEADTVGPSAALARYDDYRRTLREELGTDPGPALQTTYRQLLEGEAPAVRHGVPHEPNPLLGRDDDIAAVANLLRTSRVTSIVGPGGLGKTRLANAVSRQAEQRIVHLVGLAGVARDEDVIGEVASALGVGELGPGGHRPALGGIAGTLGPGPALLVLDNCEHVIRGAAELVHALVSMTRDLRVLTTSRAPLGLSSEAVYPLPELTLPTTIELFTQRARAARPGVELPPDVVAGLCARLDGLPLAAELAAARVRTMSVAEIAGKLADRFALLRGGPRDAPSRHHTLRAVVDWSWNLLEPDGQAALRALSVFPGGFTAAAARHLIDDDLLLEHLVDQSLLKVTDTPSGVRFRMLETVREFSTARREEAGETERVIAAFLAWAREFGAAHHDSLLGADPTPAAERIRAEQDNLMLALRHGLSRRDGATVAAAAAPLASLWQIESAHSRLATLTEETSWLLSHYRPEPRHTEVARTAATLCAVAAFMFSGRQLLRCLVTLRRLPPAPPDTPVAAMAIVLVDAPRTLAPHSTTLRLLCDSTEPMLAGIANALASYVWEHEGDLPGARRAAERMLGVFAGPNTPWLRIMACSRFGELCLQLEDGEPARRQLTAALRVLGTLGPWPDVIGLQWGLVLANLQLGAIDEAERWLERAAVDRPLDEAYGGRTFDLGVRAEIRLARGDVEAGLRLWRRAAELATVSEDPLFRVEPAGLEPWALEVQSAAVVAHAHHGRLDLVEELTAELPKLLSTMLANPTVDRSGYFVYLPVCGALLVALAMVDIDRERHTSGARMIALAECFRFVRVFQQTMSSARIRALAEQADRSAYVDARSTYADLDPEQLRVAALATVTGRG